MENEKFVSKDQYQKAQDQIKLYEERQAKIERFKNELAFRITNDFENFTFRQRNNKTTFAGYFIDRNNKRKLVLAETTCSDDDVYNKMLGKLIAVRKAIGENIDDIVEIVEPKTKITIAQIAHYDTACGKTAIDPSTSTYSGFIYSSLYK